MEFSHIPVLYNETIDSLCVRPDGIYVDATAGGGGHSAGIAEKLTTGKLICIDQDPEAIEALHTRFADDEHVTVVHSNFSAITSVLQALDIHRVDGILADLGVSSHQLDTAERGFSFHKDAPLDMRMSMEGKSAADVVNTYSENELSNLIFRYGDDKCSRLIAKAIVNARETAPIETTFQLDEIIRNAVPAKVRREGHPARKTFQALRIEVNGELTRLPDALRDMFDSLAVGGVLSVISFHSGEDAVVKNFMRSMTEGCTCPSFFPVCVCGKTPRGELPFRSKTPTEDEAEKNPRSRSAKLRSIKKCRE